MVRVDFFLSLWREACKNGVFLVPRGKNLEGISELGITLAQAREILRELNSDEYYKGPESDHNSSEEGDLWFFKKTIGQKAAYIKVKVGQREGRFFAKCLSFHLWKERD